MSNNSGKNSRGLSHVISDLEGQQAAEKSELEQQKASDLASLQSIKVEHQRALSALASQLSDLIETKPEVASIFERGVNWIRPTILVYEAEGVPWIHSPYGVKYGTFKYVLNANAPKPPKPIFLQSLLGRRPSVKITLHGSALVYDRHDDYRSTLSHGGPLGEFTLQEFDPGSGRSYVNRDSARTYLYNCQLEALTAVKELAQDTSRLGNIIFRLMQ